MSAYLDTRVSLFSGRLWHTADFEAVLATADADMIAALTDKGLPSLAAGFDHRDHRSLEQRIIALILDETRILIRPLRGTARRFLTYWTERFEINNVKTLLRGKMTGERPAVLISRLTPMGTFGHLDMQDLAHAEDVTELLRRLEAGPYAGIVRHARRAFEEGRDYFLLDAALDRGYYEGLVQHAKAMADEGGTSLDKLMGPMIDRINLVWLLRYRFNYHLPPAQVYYLLVGSSYSLSSSRLRQLATLGSVEAVLEALPEPLRGRLQGVTRIPDVFVRMDAHAAEFAAQVLRSRAPALCRAFAYLLLRERDLRSVRAILRGRHLGLAPRDIRGAMYLPAEGNA